jgi:hypothetical protein
MQFLRLECDHSQARMKVSLSLNSFPPRTGTAGVLKRWDRYCL